MLGATPKHYDPKWPEKPSPCRRCKLSEKCAVDNIACIDFYRYVLLDDSWPDTKVRTPTKELYTRIYRISGYERNRVGIDSKAGRELVTADTANCDIPGV